MGARYYNPVEGRFTQVDSSGKNFYYNFTGDNPVNYSDPSGYEFNFQRGVSTASDYTDEGKVLGAATYCVLGGIVGIPGGPAGVYLGCGAGTIAGIEAGAVVGAGIGFVGGGFNSNFPEPFIP